MLACITRFHDLGGYALWSDEAWVALSVVEPTFRKATVYFHYPQTTPPLFIAAVRGLVHLFGRSEVVLRLLPATASTLVALVIWLLARRITKSEMVALLALSLWIANPQVLRYSQELKQFTTDALVTVLLLYLTEVFLAQKDAVRRARFRWILVGSSIVGLSLSYTAALVIPAVSLRWLWNIFSRKSTRSFRREMLDLGAYVGLSMAAFATLYSIFVRPHLLRWIEEYWADYYLSDYSFGGFLRFGWRSSVDFFDFLYRHWDRFTPGDLPLLMGMFFAVGIASLVANRKVAAVVILCAPFLTTLLVASAGRYPYGGIRTDLFLMPLILIGIARGIAAPLMILQRKRPQLAWTLAVGVALTVQAVELRAFGLGYPKSNEDVRSVVEDFRSRRSDEDFAAIQEPAFFAFQYYLGEPEGRFRKFRGWGVDDLTLGRSELDRIIDDDLANDRLWLVFGLDRGARDGLIAHVEGRCALLSNASYENAALMLFSCPPRTSP